MVGKGTTIVIPEGANIVIVLAEYVGTYWYTKDGKAIPGSPKRTPPNAN